MTQKPYLRLAVMALVVVLAGQAGAQGVGYAVTPPGNNGFTNPGYPDPGERPALAFDNDVDTKYLNFGAPETIVGVVVAPAGSTTVTGIRLTTANDAPGRDPLTFLLEGSNTGTGPNAVFVPIASGPTGLLVDPGREMVGPVQNFVNAVGYGAYRITFPTLRTMVPDNTNNSMQIAEIELLNAAGADVTSPTDTVIGVHLVPEPGSMALLALGAMAVLRRRR